MSKSVYIVRCTATATIGEAWRVTATDETSAINAVIDGNGEAIELLRDWTIGDEEGRADFEAVPESDEVDIDLTPVSANENSRAALELPAMVELLRDLVDDNWTVAKINRLRCEARLILAAIDGAGDTLPDAPAPTPTGEESEPLKAARGYASNPEQWNPPSPEQVAALLAMIDGKGER